jgi:hypothetical protein
VVILKLLFQFLGLLDWDRSKSWLCIYPHITKVLSRRSPVGLCFLFAVTACANVVISSPANATTVTSLIELSANISGTPSSVSVYDNNSLIYSADGASSIQTSPDLTSGFQTLQVTAFYNGRRHGSAVSATSTVTVSETAAPSPLPSLVVQIANDMTGVNEADPRGWPPSWGERPQLGLGNAPPSGWTASTAWGVVYVASQGNSATNTRVNLRDMQLYFLSKSKGTWSLLQSTGKPDGEAYPEDFSGNSKGADVRTESDGTISVTAGMGTRAGYNFHFYPDVRGAINPNDVGGIVALFQARLIVGNPNLPDDRSTANYVAESGADYWPSLTGALPASYNGVTPPVGNGKFKYVRSNWRSFAMTTMTQSQLANNPPPINLSGVLP